MIISNLPTFDAQDRAAQPAREAAVTISLLVPTYNRCDFLELLLARFRDELSSLPPASLEVVVVDNASTDGTEAVAKKFDRHDWFRYIRNARNVGASKNLFIGLNFCRGSYIWWMGDDDYPEDGTVAAVLDAIRWNPEVGTIFLNRRLISAKDDSMVCPEYIPGLANCFDTALMDLLQRIGPMTLFGSISAFLFKNQSQVIEHHQHHVDLMTSFPHVGLLLEQFHGKPAVVLGNRYVVCRIDNHRLETFDYARMMLRSPNYGLSVGYAKLLHSLVKRNNFPIYRIQVAHEYSPFQTSSLAVPEYISYHLRCASAQGDPPNIYELTLIRELFAMFGSEASRRKYETVELTLRATWFAHRVFLRIMNFSVTLRAMKMMAGCIYGLRTAIRHVRALRQGRDPVKA